MLRTCTFELVGAWAELAIRQIAKTSRLLRHLAVSIEGGFLWRPDLQLVQGLYALGFLVPNPSLA